MVSNIQQIRKEAIKRAINVIYIVRKQNLSRKEVRAKAFECAKNTIELMNAINNGEKLNDLQINIMAQKATLVAMKSF